MDYEAAEQRYLTVIQERMECSNQESRRKNVMICLNAKLRGEKDGANLLLWKGINLHYTATPPHPTLSKQPCLACAVISLHRSSRPTVTLGAEGNNTVHYSPLLAST